MWFELGVLFLASVYVLIYSSDALYWIYENEREKLEKAEEEKSEKEIPDSIKSLYS